MHQKYEPSPAHKPKAMETIQTARNDRRARFARSFARNVITYAVICGFLTLVNALTSPHYWWVAWVAGGWGPALLLPLLFHLVGCDEEEDEAK